MANIRILLACFSIPFFQQYQHFFGFPNVNYPYGKEGSGIFTRRNPSVLFEDFGSKYVKLNTLFREILDESRNIFIESNFFIDKSKLIYDDTKIIFENIRCLRMTGRGGGNWATADGRRMGIGSMKIDAVLVDDLAIESLSFDRQTNNTTISHVFDDITVFGTMDFGYAEAGRPVLKNHPFALTYPHGTLNVTRMGQYPYYNIVVDSKQVTEPACGANASEGGSDDDDRFLRTLGAYAVEKLKGNGGLLNVVATSFVNGFAATVDQQLSGLIDLVPEHYRPNDWFTDRCDCSGGLSVTFPSVDMGQLRTQLASRQLEHVNFRNHAGRHPGYVATFGLAFRDLRLLTDVTVNMTGWDAPIHVINVDFAVDHVEIVVRAIARNPRRGHDAKIRHEVDVAVHGLSVETHDQLEAYTEWLIGNRLPLCMIQAVKRGVARAIDDIAAAAKPTVSWGISIWGFGVYNTH